MIAKQLPARHGLLWVLAAWQLLRRYPRQLTSMTLAYFSLLLVMNLIPYIGPVLLSKPQAPSSSARRYTNAASSTRMAMAHTDGP